MKKDKNLEGLVFRQEEVLKIYEKWINIIQEKHMISEYLFKNNYRKIAIYGLGRIGKQLYKEMISSQIEISYVIDQKYSIANRYYEQTRCYHPNDKLPETDLIIITISNKPRSLVVSLKRKVSCSVKSINDILFVIE